MQINVEIQSELLNDDREVGSANERRTLPHRDVTGTRKSGRFRVGSGTRTRPEIFVFPGRFRVLGIEPEFLFSTSGRVRRLFFFFFFVYLFHLLCSVRLINLRYS
jgi:hypothetical protein